MVHVVQAEGRDARARYRLSVRELPPTGCADGLGPPEQVGSALNLGGSAVDGDWGLDGSVFNGLTLHENQLWAVHVDVDQPGDPSTRVQTGPYVQRWNGAAWQDMAFPAAPDVDVPGRPAITSDAAGRVYVAFTILDAGTEQSPGGDCLCPACPQTFDLRGFYDWTSSIVQVWVYDGAWSFVAEHRPVFSEAVDCTLFMRPNHSWVPQGGGGGGSGSLGPLLLAAFDGHYAVAWQESGDEVGLTTLNTGCVSGLSCSAYTEVDVTSFSRLFTATDGGSLLLLSSDPAAGVADLVWDADSGAPLLSTTETSVLDARDGSVIQDIADKQAGTGVIFSNADSGERYLLGNQNPLGRYVWETSPDCTVAAAPLDGSDYYANGVAPMPSVGVRIIAEPGTLWQLGAIGRGCAGTGDSPCNGGPFYQDGILASAAFVRMCTQSCPPEDWAAIGVNPAGLSQEACSNYTQLKFGEALYAIVRTSDLTNTYPSEHRVYRVPIRRCVSECLVPFIQGQSFSTGQHYNEGQAAVPWAVVWGGGSVDRILYYVDNVLVYTDEPPGQPSYYGGAAPGNYDVGALSLGDHVMKVVLEIDANGGPAGDCAALDVINEATITIDPVVVPATYQHVTYRIDGTAYGPYVVNLGAGGVQLGLISGSQGMANHLIRNVKIGTSGYGSTEIWDEALTSGSVVPPFDSQVGGGDLSITANGMLVQNATGSDAYGEKDFVGTTDLYIQFQVNFDASEVSGGNDGFCIPFVLLDDSLVWADSIAGDFRSGSPNYLKWSADNAAAEFGGPIADSTWYTVDLFYSTT